MKMDKIKVGDIVVNVDSWVGEALEVKESCVKMKYEKCGKKRVEDWDIDSVRLADESEIKEYSQFHGKVTE